MVPLRTKGDEGIVWDGWPVGRSVRSSGCVRPKDLDFGVASVAGLDAGAAAAARTAADGEAGIEGGKHAASKGASAGFSGLYARVSSRSTAMGRERGGMAPAPGRRRHLRRGANRRNQEQYGTIICFPIGLQGGGKRLCAGRIRTLDGLIHACNLRKARKKWPCLHQYAVANQPDGQAFDGKRVAREDHDGGVVGVFGVQFDV